jgi:hypothetical protein
MQEALMGYTKPSQKEITPLIVMRGYLARTFSGYRIEKAEGMIFK